MRYQILLDGKLDDTAAEMFAGLELRSEGDVTAISGDLDQAALHGQLERIRALGLELIEVRRVHGRSPPPAAPAEGVDARGMAGANSSRWCRPTRRVSSDERGSPDISE